MYNLMEQNLLNTVPLISMDVTTRGVICILNCIGASVASPLQRHAKSNDFKTKRVDSDILTSVVLRPLYSVEELDFRWAELW